MKKRSPRILRVLEVSRTLKDYNNNVKQKIKKSRIPFARIAHAVVWAELKKKNRDDSMDEKVRSADALKKNKARLKLVQVDKLTPKKLHKKARTHVRNSNRFALADKKTGAFARGQDNSEEVGMTQFCLDMQRMFDEQGARNPNYKLIADIANLFGLSENTQTKNTIKQRMHRLRHQENTQPLPSK